MSPAILFTVQVRHDADNRTMDFRCPWRWGLMFRVPSSQTLLFPDPRPLVERLGDAFFRQLPETPGVYLMHDANATVLYVGKAKNLRQRLGHYRVANPDRMARRHLRLLRHVAHIELRECADEATALAHEAELIRTLKPRFNRAGVWPGAPRCLAWRRAASQFELACLGEPLSDWHCSDAVGGATYLRASLARLLWLAIHPSKGIADLPAGWVKGRTGNLVQLPCAEDPLETMLAKFLDGDAELTDWISDRTESLTHPCDVALRDADLESVLLFQESIVRRRARGDSPEFARKRESAVDSDNWLPACVPDGSLS